jgi:hypothetical protein
MNLKLIVDILENERNTFEYDSRIESIICKKQMIDVFKNLKKDCEIIHKITKDTSELIKLAKTHKLYPNAIEYILLLLKDILYNRMKHKIIPIKKELFLINEFANDLMNCRIVKQMVYIYYMYNPNRKILMDYVITLENEIEKSFKIYFLDEYKRYKTHSFSKIKKTDNAIKHDFLKDDTGEINEKLHYFDLQYYDIGLNLKEKERRIKARFMGKIDTGKIWYKFYQ